jgi:apolipoprotein N-acyltransferase
VLSLAVVFGLAEWLRAWLLTGFPWNLAGETWAAGSAVSQAASVVGVFGLSVLTIGVAAAPAVLFDAAPRRARFATLAIAALLLAGLWGWGASRLADARVADTGVRLRVVQADVDQKDKWRPENLPLIIEDYVRLSRAPGADAIDVVVWPEASLPAVFETLFAPGSPYAPLAERVLDAVSPGQLLFMGVNRMGGSPEAPTFHNSVVMLRRETVGARVVGVYDKHRLLPFGEYLPFGALMSRVGVRALVQMPYDFTPGPPPRPLPLPGVPPGQILICWESVYPDLVGKGGGRPQWLVIPSNDAWFGRTSGPWQHLNVGAYRAIEQGVPVVRATPTGVSAVLDPYGRIARDDRLGVEVAGVIDAALPRALAPTPYSRWRDGPFWALIVFGAAVVVFLRAQAYKRRDRAAWP